MRATTWRLRIALVESTCNDLRTKRSDVKARYTGSYNTDPAEKVRDMEVTISREEFAKMAKSVPYTIEPVNGKKGYEWKVREGVTVTRD